MGGYRWMDTGIIYYVYVGLLVVIIHSHYLFVQTIVFEVKSLAGQSPVAWTDTALLE